MNGSRIASVLVIIHLYLVGPSLVSGNNVTKYTPDWDSLQTRPMPSWFDEAKVGVIIHWGVYCVKPHNQYTSEWFWDRWRVHKDKDILDFMHDNYRSKFTYQEFADDFTATHYEPEHWASVFKQSGAKYFILTAKHHDGYVMWNTSFAPQWNSMDIGPNRDLVGELVDAVRKTTDLRVGLYNSLIEWYNPIYMADFNSGFKQNTFAKHKLLPEMKEMVMKYRPEYIYSDGAPRANSSYWQSKEFLAWLYNESPVKDTVLANDRWGKDTEGLSLKGFVHSTHDHDLPDSPQEKYDSILRIDHISFGYRPDAPFSDFVDDRTVLNNLIHTVAFGGNFLFNVGPTKDGMIPVIIEERLLSMGKFLDVNGEAIYGTQVWDYPRDSKESLIWYVNYSK